MPFPTEITVSQLSRLVGLPGAPNLIDVRTDEQFKGDPRLIPTAQRQDSRDMSRWAKQYAGRSVIAICQQGVKFSQGAAAWLRHEGLDAQSLEGGFEAWKKAGEPLLRADKIPQSAMETAARCG
jgi:rhodanese-related sulfurtransferase